MSDVMTKSMARNVFYGGSIFFILVFGALTLHSHLYARNKAIDPAALTASVAAGKHVWERNACIDCHTLLGEGAYFAPELGNVMKRWGVQDDPEGAVDALKSWMQAMPTGIEGRRQMPLFELTDEEFRELADFLLFTGTINTQDWPPNDAG
ncbi:c-type cytochrome [Paracoccus sp. (in: a-proteobacteria)]|uniref:c-type cytochrome n=1 Tax=Paracoccus sp. TaxID=267 RepID=UPI003A8541AD